MKAERKSTARRRGRPGRTPKQREQHGLIGRVAYRLHLWGFPLRGPHGLLAATATAALRILNVGGHGGGRAQPLSEERVEQLMETYRAGRRSWSGAGMPSASTWTIESRRNLLPNRVLSLPKLAEQLIRRGGTWPRAVCATTGAPVPPAEDLIPRRDPSVPINFVIKPYTETG